MNITMGELRDMFAGLAMQALISSHKITGLYNEGVLTKEAYDIAEAMIVERDKRLKVLND